VNGNAAVQALIETNGVATAVVLDGIDQPGHALRAIANDPFDSVVAAMAYANLTAVFPMARGWLATVLGDPKAVSTVKQLASRLDVSPKTLERRGAAPGAALPNTVIEVAQASVCVLWATPDGPDDAAISKAVGYADGRGARELMTRVFNTSLDECRRLTGNGPSVRTLEYYLKRYSERERERERENPS
jgi:hypothetical protein